MNKAVHRKTIDASLGVRDKRNAEDMNELTEILGAWPMQNAKEKMETAVKTITTNNFHIDMIRAN